MDKSGQLSFSDDPLLHKSNQVFQLLEEGNFNDAVTILDEIMSEKPDYPGIEDAYRTARFWNNRFQDILKLKEGKSTADFLMKEWQIYDNYAETKKMKATTAYNAVMRYIFFKASENYKKAFLKQEDTSNNFDLLLNLGDCFLRLNEYKNTIETLEFARSSYRSNARLLSILGEAYFHEEDFSRSLLYFREAFFINPSDIDLSVIKAKPILDLVDIVVDRRPACNDIRDWIPVFAFTEDIFYVRRNITKHEVDKMSKDIYNFEKNIQAMDEDTVPSSNVLPRLINKYLWLLDYYEFQEYDEQNLAEIRRRLITLDRETFEEYFHSP